MPDYIKDHCKEDEAKLEKKYAQISASADLGAVILGETHGKPHARAIICDLIKEGKVKRLFLEIPSQKPDGNKAGKKEFDASLLNTDIKTSDAWKAMNVFISLLDKLCHNKIPMADLIPLAISNGVKVYFCDNSDTRVPEKEEGLNDRDAVMGNIIRRKSTKTGGKGTLALVGAFHLYATSEDRVPVQMCVGTLPVQYVGNVTL